MGLVAVLLWSSSVAFIRTLSESLGPISTIVHAYLAERGGGAGPGRGSSREGWAVSGGLPRKYLWGCGALFVAYTTCYCLAVGLATDRAQVLAVGLVNYLWPSLTLLLSVPILGYRARWFLVPGMLVATAGMVVATTAGSGLSLAGLRASVVGQRAGLRPGLRRGGHLGPLLQPGAALGWGGGRRPPLRPRLGPRGPAAAASVGETSTWNARVVGELALHGALRDGGGLRLLGPRDAAGATWCWWRPCRTSRRCCRRSSPRRTSGWRPDRRSGWPVPW